jgi:hypothetical protein
MHAVAGIDCFGLRAIAHAGAGGCAVHGRNQLVVAGTEAAAGVIGKGRVGGVHATIQHADHDALAAAGTAARHGQVPHRIGTDEQRAAESVERLDHFFLDRFHARQLGDGAGFFGGELRGHATVGYFVAVGHFDGMAKLRGHAGEVLALALAHPGTVALRIGTVGVELLWLGAGRRRGCTQVAHATAVVEGTGIGELDHVGARCACQLLVASGFSVVDTYAATQTRADHGGECRHANSCRHCQTPEIER